VDKQTGEPVSGAGFTIRVSDKNSDEESRGLYVQADGSLASSAHEFVTSGDGTFEVRGLDEGTYIISETTTPKGYLRLNEGITIAVNSELNGQTISLAKLSSNISDADGEEPDTARIAEVNTVDGNAGSVTIQVANERWIPMPLTGQTGLRGPVGLGTGLVVLAAVGLAARRSSRHRS
jgi:uncharacterized surface anchored protein